MEDSPQRRFATQRVRHTNVTENLSVSVRPTFATVPMRKIRHTMVIGWGWVGRVGVRGLGSKGWGELGIPQPRSPDLTPPTSTLPDPNPPTPSTPTPPTSTPLTPTQPQSITVVWRIFHIGAVANVCPTVTLKFSVTFVVWRILWRLQIQTTLE